MTRPTLKGLDERLSTVEIRLDVMSRSLAEMVVGSTGPVGLRGVEELKGAMNELKGLIGMLPEEKDNEEGL